MNIYSFTIILVIFSLINLINSKICEYQFTSYKNNNISRMSIYPVLKCKNVQACINDECFIRTNEQLYLYARIRNNIKIKCEIGYYDKCEYNDIFIKINSEMGYPISFNENIESNEYKYIIIYKIVLYNIIFIAIIVHMILFFLIVKNSSITCIRNIFKYKRIYI